MRQSVAPRYGEWGDFTGAFSLNDNELWANMTDSIFQISHVEVGTDITVDEVFSAADQMDWMQSASAVMGAYKPANA